MAALPKPSDSQEGGKATVLLGAQWGDEGKGACLRCSFSRCSLVAVLFFEVDFGRCESALRSPCMVLGRLVLK